MNRYRIIVKKITVIKNRLRFLWLITAICSSTLFADLCIASPGLTVSSSVDSKTLDVTMADTSQPSHDDIIYSNTMEGLMRASRTRFVEGFRFIRTGYFESAQKEFDAAVDMVLQSGWELAYAPTLREFFQDLIEQIHYAESNYVYVSQDIEDEDYEEHLIEGYEHLDLNTITDNPAIREALASGLPKNNFEIPITINEMVIKSMDFWLNQGNRQFMEGLRRSGRYYPMIERIFREESIPLDVIHLAQVESLFKPQALSRARAKGIWQFMERTGRQYGLKITRDIDERSDPELSTRAAARYLNDLYAMFNDWNLVLAAYNWGEGRLRQLINSTGLNDFWELANLRRRMPNETRNHVPLIKASVILAKNPERFGLTIEKDPPLEYVKIPVSKPIDLRAAARVLSTTFDELKRLNPALRGSATPANYPGFQLRVPVGDPSDIQTKLASLPRTQIRATAGSDGRHRIQSGETLSGIAARHRTTVNELMQMNNLSSHRIRAGDYLYVPSAVTRTSAKRPTFPAPDGFNGQHQVSPGETLSGIASRYRTSVNELMAANRLSSHQIRAGDYLYVPADAAAARNP